MKSLKPSIGGYVVPGRYRFHEPDQKRTFATLAQVVSFVAEYREANGRPHDREEISAEIQDWLCGQFEEPERWCLDEGKAMPETRRGKRVYGNGYQGQDKWKKLHTAALAGEITGDWMKDFTLSLPCGECRRGWRKILAEAGMPAPDTDPLQVFMWTVDRHNEVRRKIGQEIMSWQAACVIYGVDGEESGVTTTEANGN